MIEVAVNAHSSKHRVRFAGGTVNVEAAGDQAVDDMLDLRVGSAFLHHDDHKGFLFPFLNVSAEPGLRPGSTISLSTHTAAAVHSFPLLPWLSPECMASRSAARASSMMRSNKRRIAPSVKGPELLRSAFSSTSFSRSGWYSGIFASCLSLPISGAHCERSFRSCTSFLSISSMRRRQSLRFMAQPRAARGRVGPHL